jgi:hypothetical protein
MRATDPGSEVSANRAFEKKQVRRKNENKAVLRHFDVDSGCLAGGLRSGDTDHGTRTAHGCAS